MIHILLDISAIILAAFGLNEILNLGKDKLDSIDKKKINKIFRYSYVFGGICLLMFLFLLIGKSFYYEMASNTQLKIVVEQLQVIILFLRWFDIVRQWIAILLIVYYLDR